MKLITSLLFLLTFFGNAYAASTKEDYELQEKCGKQAQEFFIREYSNIAERMGRLYYSVTVSDDKYIVTTDYTNHYNKKLNKCFILVTIIVMTKETKDTKSSFSTAKDLKDINENKMIGIFHSEGPNNKPGLCEVLDKHCQSQDGWDSLAKPYMEE